MKRILAIFAFLLFVAITAAGFSYARLFILPQFMHADNATQAPTATHTEPAKVEAEPKVSQAEAERKAAQQRVDNIRAHLKSETIDGVTYYTYPQEKPADGLSLEPLLADGDFAQVRCNLLYFYNINDGTNTAWIHGDHLRLEADGEAHTWALDPQRRHDRVARDAESLEELYQIPIEASEIPLLQAAAHADEASITYWQAGGKERSHALTAKEKARLGEIVELYTLLQQ